MVNKLFLGLSELLSGSGCFRQRRLTSPQLSSPLSWDLVTTCLCSQLKEDEAFQERLSFMFVLWWWMIEPCGFSVFTDKLFLTSDRHASGSGNGSQVWQCTRLGGTLFGGSSFPGPLQRPWKSFKNILVLLTESGHNSNRCVKLSLILYT